MNTRIFNFIYKKFQLLNKFNLHVMKFDSFLSMREDSQAKIYLEIFKNADIPFKDATSLIQKSKSQIGQDLFALVNNNFKSSGYFVEFGATDGLGLSNTYLLEKEFHWSGILAEPAKIWHESLRKNRNCNISDLCVWNKSGAELIFTEVTDETELSTISNFEHSDSHGFSRGNTNKYSVKTVTLQDLLDKFDAPKIIDFLSIDTEGSEFEILEKFDFNSYSFNVICVEHNFTEIREKIYALLTANGYVRTLENVSAWDDWYLLNR